MADTQMGSYSNAAVERILTGGNAARQNAQQPSSMAFPEGKA